MFLKCFGGFLDKYANMNKIIEINVIPSWIDFADQGMDDVSGEGIRTVL
jgi:hypothetical protein